MTWKQYLAVMREINQIKKNGMYGYYVFGEDEFDIRGYVNDGKPFDKKILEDRIIKNNPKYHAYFLPKKIRDEVRAELSNKTIAEINQRINKINFVKKQEKDAFLLKHQIELDELVKIQEVSNAVQVIKQYCKYEDPCIRYQEFFLIDDLRKVINCFIKKAEESPSMRKMQDSKHTQYLIELHNN